MFERALKRPQSLCLNLSKEGEYYGLVNFGSIVRTVKVLRSNIAIKTFTAKLPWKIYILYVNCFIMVKGLQLFVNCESVPYPTAENLTNVFFSFIKT